jgi:hypothetical protein
LGRARYLNPAGFGARVAYSAVATALLVLAVGGSPGPAPLEARGASPWPAPVSARVPAGVRAAGLSLLRASRYDPVAVYLNGSRVAGQPGSVMLTPHLAIAVTYRPGGVTIPASYAFPAGT